MLKNRTLLRSKYRLLVVFFTIVVSLIPFLIILVSDKNTSVSVSNLLMWLLVATLAGSTFLQFRVAVVQVLLISLAMILLGMLYDDVSMAILIRPFIQYTILSFIILSLRYYLLREEKNLLVNERILHAEAKQTEETLRQQKKQLEILRQVGLELTSELDIDTLIQSIIVHAVHMLGADTGSLWLRDVEEDVLRLMTNYGGRFPVGMTMDRGNGITGKVWELEKPLFINDYSAWTGRLNVLDSKGLSQSVAAVPVINKGEVQGVINVGAKAKDAFCQEDLELLELLAAQAAVALANAHLHTQLKQHSTELERSNKELQDFAYIASHDLQEPLRKIQTFSDRLAVRYADSLDDKGLDYLVRMRETASRMQNLIVDLLAFSRVTSMGRPLTAVDLNQVINIVINDLEVPIQAIKAQMIIEPLPTIMADETQMRQLFQNLLSNALKFTIPNQTPVIQVICQTVPNNEHPKQHIISVADNGIGFEEKYLDRIFNVFQRLHSRQNYEGTGVGLALCEKIVARHQGTITAQSQLGNGATFIITLPYTIIDTNNLPQV